MTPRDRLYLWWHNYIGRHWYNWRYAGTAKGRLLGGKVSKEAYEWAVDAFKEVDTK